jgi:hypothetical protein
VVGNVTKEIPPCPTQARRRIRDGDVLLATGGAKGITAE